MKSQFPTCEEAVFDLKRAVFFDLKKSIFGLERVSFRFEKKSNFDVKNWFSIGEKAVFYFLKKLKKALRSFSFHLAHHLLVAPTHSPPLSPS